MKANTKKHETVKVGSVEVKIHNRQRTTGSVGARGQGQALDQLSQALSFEVVGIPWEGPRPAAETWGIVPMLAYRASCDA